MAKDKGKVIDLFSRERMDEAGQDTDLNDELVNEHGEYLGALPLGQANVLRERGAHLMARQRQIDAMAYQWGQEYGWYVQQLESILGSLGILPKDFDPYEHQLFIDKEGHVFLVRREILTH